MHLGTIALGQATHPHEGSEGSCRQALGVSPRVTREYRIQQLRDKQALGAFTYLDLLAEFQHVRCFMCHASWVVNNNQTRTTKINKAYFECGELICYICRKDRLEIFREFVQLMRALTPISQEKCGRGKRCRCVTHSARKVLAEWAQRRMEYKAEQIAKQIQMWDVSTWNELKLRLKGSAEC